MAKSKLTTHYATLELPPCATQQELHEQFKRLAIQHHPDKCTATDRKLHTACAFGAAQPRCGICRRTKIFADITAAYAVLKDVRTRHEYDKYLKIKFALCSICGGAGRITRQKGFTQQVVQQCGTCGGSGMQSL